jgi:uncharacterized protein (TIGR02145 family)
MFFCINDEANGQEQTGTLRGRDGNIYTIKIMPGNKTWMMSNLNINIPGSYGYEMQSRKVIYMAICIRGNRHRKDVSLLGEVWRLPTNEEWQKWPKGMVACAVIRMMMVKQLTRR